MIVIWTFAIIGMLTTLVGIISLITNRSDKGERRDNHFGWDPDDEDYNY